MRTFSTLYKQLTGVFPEVKAKNASTETALDGTDWADINIDDILWGPLQALLNFVSQTPDGVAETYDTSQIFNAMREAFSTAEKQTITTAGAVVFGKTNHEVEVDLSLGNLAISQLPVPDFIGQKVHIYGVGSGIGSIVGGTGLYANDVFFTENTGGVFLTSISAGVGGEWRAENGVSADYLSGINNTEKTPLGKLVQWRYDPVGVTTDGAARYVWTFSVNMSGDYMYAGGSNNLEGHGGSVYNPGSITVRTPSVSSATADISERVEGKY